LALLLIFSLESGSKGGSSPAQILAIDGVVTMLRVHNIGTGYGPPQDFLDAEVIVALDSAPNKRFGFQLRPNENQLVAQGMLSLLQQSFEHSFPVRLEYEQEPGKNSSILFRVILFK
jgi:hypothetical protein